VVKVSESGELRSMADLLRSGATLTSLSCPVCASPLFKLKSGELWCAKCKKRVVVVKEEETEAVSPVLLGSLESTLLAKIQELDRMMRDEEDIDQLLRLGAVLSNMLENLERLRRIMRYKP